MDNNKNLRNSRLIRLPIIAILGIIVTIFFFVPPKIIFLPKGNQFVQIKPVDIIAGRNFYKLDMVLFFTNKSLRKGSIDTFEIYPKNLSISDYKIYSSELDRKNIRWNRKERISLSITFEQNILYQRDNNIQETEPLVLRFFAEDGSQIMDDNGNIAWLIFGFLKSDRPFTNK